MKAASGRREPHGMLGFSVIEVMVGTLLLAVTLAGLLSLQDTMRGLDERRRRDTEAFGELVRVAEESRRASYDWWDEQLAAGGGQFEEVAGQGSSFRVVRRARRAEGQGMPEESIEVTVQAIAPDGRVTAWVTLLKTRGGL